MQSPTRNPSLAVHTLPSALAHHAEAIPDQLFTRILKNGVERTARTFAAAWQWAAQWAALYTEHHIARGDRVIIALPNSDSFVGAYLGALLVGAAPAPVAPPRGAAEGNPYIQILAARIRLLDAKALVAPTEFSASIRPLHLGEGPGVRAISEADIDSSVRRDSIACRPDDLALIQFTSGTLGKPKAVMLTHRALLAQTRAIQSALALHDRFKDWAVSWLPLFHDMGLVGFLLTPMAAGGAVHILHTEDFILRPGLWLKALSETRATITGGPPSAYALCARRIKESEAAQYDLSAIRIALVGAEMVFRESLEAFADRFRASRFRAASLMPTYGLAENALAVTLPPLDPGPRFDRVDARQLSQGIAAPASEGRSFASVGVPVAKTEVAIVDDSGNRLPERRIGEVLIRSDSLMLGYYGDPHATKEALRDGWLFTGDLGYLAEGQLHIAGRKKEVIIVGGRNYYPDDVEQIVSAVEGVRADRVVAVGCDDPQAGTEKLIVLVETDRAEQAERSALRLRIRQTLLAADYPVSEVVLLKPKSIQSTLTGKLKRVETQQRYVAGEFDGE